GDQPQHQRASVAQRLASREPLRDPIHHLIEATPPPIDIYAVCRGGCGIITFDSSHKLRKMPQSPPLPAQTRRQPSIYGCSTNEASLLGDLNFVRNCDLPAVSAQRN